MIPVALAGRGAAELLASINCERQRVLNLCGPRQQRGRWPARRREGAVFEELSRRLENSF